MSAEAESSPRQLPFADRRQLVHKQLQAVRLLSESLSQHTKVDDLIVKALQTALEVINAEAGSVLLADPATKQLVFRHSIGPSPVPYGTPIPWDKGIAGAVFQSGKPEVVTEVKKDERHFRGIDERTGFETRSMVTLPLKKWEGEPIGVLNVLNKREGGFYEDDVATLTFISALTATAIEQAQLFEEAKLAEVVGLLGDIGHDVKNMSSPIVMGARIMQGEINDLFQSKPELMQDKTAQTFRETCSEVIGMQLRGAERILDRMKEFADCVKGLSAPPNFAPCQVADVVKSVLETLRLVADEKGITINLEGLETLPSIHADERRLYNAFYNLINNAIPEVPAGGSITVRGSEDPAAKAIHLAVADTGRGMPPQVRERLFTKRAVSTKPGGTGLGTKIIKDVVDAHGGQITVESEEGKGTTFHIYLPLQPPNLTERIKES